MNAFLILSLIASLALDYISDVSMCYGGRLAYFPAACDTLALLGEFRAGADGQNEGAGAKLRRALPVALACAALAGTAGYIVTVPNAYSLPILSYFDSVEGSGKVVLSRGPLKGLRQNSIFEGRYEAVLSDIDSLSEKDGTLYVADMYPLIYLYSDMRNGSYTPYYVEPDMEIRQTRYWTSFPDKRPDVIYIPYWTYDYLSIDAPDEDALADKLSFVASLGDSETTRGDGGYIVRMLSWDL